MHLINEYDLQPIIRQYGADPILCSQKILAIIMKERAEAFHEYASLYASHRLCHCELTGKVHVVSANDHCELCNWQERQSINIANIKTALEHNQHE